MGQVSSEARNLQLTCSLNLMSCYLKTKQFSEAVAEGTMVCLLSNLSTSSCHYMCAFFKRIDEIKASYVGHGADIVDLKV